MKWWDPGSAPGSGPPVPSLQSHVICLSQSDVLKSPWLLVSFKRNIHAITWCFTSRVFRDSSSVHLMQVQLYQENLDKRQSKHITWGQTRGKKTLLSLTGSTLRHVTWFIIRAAKPLNWGNTKRVSHSFTLCVACLKLPSDKVLMVLNIESVRVICAFSILYQTMLQRHNGSFYDPCDEMEQ